MYHFTCMHLEIAYYSMHVNSGPQFECSYIAPRVRSNRHVSIISMLMVTCLVLLVSHICWSLVTPAASGKVYNTIK